MVAKSAGLKGRFIKDDIRKYPGRESLGFLINAAGGFAGGERGLRAFVETGEIPLLPPGSEKNSSGASPVFVAITVGAAGLLGLLLTASHSYYR